MDAPGPSFADVLRRQRMVRPPYADRPVPGEVLDRVLAASRKAPSAGFTQGVSFVVLSGEGTRRFAHHVWPRRPPPGCEQLPAVAIPLEHRQAYLDRYAEPDKAGTGLHEAAAWPAHYWTIDAAFAAMAVLLAATAEGLGAWFFGIFAGERALLDELGVPADRRAIGAIAFGYPAPAERRSPSLARGRKPFEELVHHERW